MLDIVPYFIIYVTLFRLAIIAAGVISIVLGYRLFCKGIWPKQPGDQDTTFDAKVAGANFTLKNAAPGTFFALFGVIIISFMLSGMPEFSFETLNQATPVEPPVKTGSIPTTSKTVLKMRGDDKQTVDNNNTVKVLTQTCQDHYDNGQLEQAMTACYQAVNLATDSLNMLARLYQEQNKFTEAQTLAKAVITMDPGDAGALRTLAVILCGAEQHNDAQHWLKQAIDLETNPDNKDELNDLLESFKEGQCELDE